MSSPRTPFPQALEAVLVELEQVSAVEVVVCCSDSSGSYRDLDHTVGFLVSTLFLFVAIHSPIEFHVDTVLLWSVAVYAASVLVMPRLPWLRRLLASPRRRRVQVERAAAAAFQQRGLALTRDRTGLLVFLSELEGQAVLLPDSGVESRLPRAVLHAVEQQCRLARGRAAFQQSVLEGLRGLKEPLAKHLPVAADDTNELPNAILMLRGGY